MAVITSQLPGFMWDISKSFHTCSKHVKSHSWQVKVFSKRYGIRSFPGVEKLFGGPTVCDGESFQLSTCPLTAGQLDGADVGLEGMISQVHWTGQLQGQSEKKEVYRLL